MINFLRTFTGSVLTLGFMYLWYRWAQAEELLMGLEFDKRVAREAEYEHAMEEMGRKYTGPNFYKIRRMHRRLLYAKLLCFAIILLIALSAILNFLGLQLSDVFSSDDEHVWR